MNEQENKRVRTKKWILNQCSHARDFGWMTDQYIPYAEDYYQERYSVALDDLILSLRELQEDGYIKKTFWLGRYVTTKKGDALAEQLWS